VLVDLPGHGEAASLVDVTFDALVADLQEHLTEQGLTGADLVGSSMGARMVLELARRGVGRHVVALDPGGFWTPGERTAFGASVRASFALVRALRPALPALTGSAVGRTALLPQFTPRPWAVPRRSRSPTCRASPPRPRCSRRSTRCWPAARRPAGRRRVAWCSAGGGATA
jgi:pimeloyl-ACP methyl ester carboxylesterase